MLNPIISYRKSSLVYVLSWVFVGVLHFVILFFFFDINLIISLSDAFIYTALLSAFGIGIWYIVRYLAFDDESYHLILIDHLVTGGIIVLMWLFAGYFVLTNLFSANSFYTDFLEKSLAWRFVYGILLYSVIVMVYYLINYYKNYQQKLIEQTLLKQTLQESELNLLKSQINPHFLFNSLNSINSLIITEPERAREMILELSDFLRYTVRNNENEKVSLHDEMENIRKYLDIEKIRFGSRLVLEDDFEEGCLEMLMPNMILQPIYENAIKHGVNESTDAVTISTKCFIENGELKIVVSNNFTPGNLSRKGKGIGLENIRKRLMLIFKRHDLLNIVKYRDIFEVQITIPQ